MDGIAIIFLEVTLLVVFDEGENGLTLTFALSISNSSFEVSNDLTQGLPIESILLVDLLVELTILGLCHTTIQSE